MKKLLMVLILIWPIAGFCQTHIRDRQTGDTARVIDGKLQTSANSNSKAGIKIEGVNPGTNDIRISNCNIACSGSVTYSECGIQVGDADANVKIWNCIIWSFANGGNTLGTDGIATTGHTSLSIYNTVIIGDYIGLLNHSAVNDITAKNCYAFCSTNASCYAYYSPDGTSINKTTCASSDNTGSAGLQNIAYSTSTFINVTAGSEDYTLAAGSSLLNAGTDTSGDSAPLNFTVDIIGTTRPQGAAWDIGAIENIVSGSPIRIQKQSKARIIQPFLRR